MSAATEILPAAGPDVLPFSARYHLIPERCVIELTDRRGAGGGVHPMSRFLSLIVAVLVFAAGALWAAPVAVAAAHHVMIENYAYSPATITVRAGDTVTWTNHDEAQHDVVTTSGPSSFRSPLLAKGQSWSYTFSAAGTYSYYCSLHPDMRAKAIAQPAPATTRAAPTITRAPAPQQTAAAPAPGPTGTTRTTSPAAKGSTTTSPVPAPQPVQQAAPPIVTESLDPMLLVAGVVTGVAVLCLLLLGSRRID